MTTMKHVDAYWRAANSLSVGQIYLLGNPPDAQIQARAHREHGEDVPEISGGTLP